MRIFTLCFFKHEALCFGDRKTGHIFKFRLLTGFVILSSGFEFCNILLLLLDLLLLLFATLLHADDIFFPLLKSVAFFCKFLLYVPGFTLQFGTHPGDFFLRLQKQIAFVILCLFPGICSLHIQIFFGLCYIFLCLLTLF